MKIATARKFWRKVIRLIEDGSPTTTLPNPALDFTADVKAGKYDALSDEEYGDILWEVEQLGALWNGTARRTASDLLLTALGKTEINSKDLGVIVERLAACSARSQYVGEQSPLRLPQAEPKARPMARTRIYRANRPENFSPKIIYDYLSQRVLGQDEAKKAAAMVLYNHVDGRRTNALFCGPTGCGKSEIWRHLAREYPKLIRIVDASHLSADGWKGSFHIRDIFENVSAEDLERRGLIVVLDEADKICCESAVGSGGTDYNVLIQNNLLKMLDGDVIEFGADDGNRQSFRVDCQNVSVVLLGAFERLMQGKSRTSGGIGFGVRARVQCDYNNTDIDFPDLINAGMRREIAGRINRIVSLRPLTEEDYAAILLGPVLDELQFSGGYRIELDDASARHLARQAVEKGLGVRWMRSRIMAAVDEQMFLDHLAGVYTVTFPPEGPGETEQALRLIS